MKRRIHIDMIGGLAGDMFLAAALDAGLVSREELEAVLTAVGLGDITIHTERVTRYGISATHITFSGWDPSQERDHRHLSEIEEMIERSSLEPEVKARAVELFRVLGRAESETHDIPLERVHFHEIGAIDSILDFVGAAYVIETAQARWTAGRVPRGEGVIQMSHGPMPALAPATAKLLVGFELESRGVEGELVTPTGAAILRALGVHEVAAPGAGRLSGEGYGAGTRDFEGFANVARLTLYEEGAAAHGMLEDRVVRLTAELDDEHPEVLAHVERVLLDAGALDVVRSAVMMKKGRLGVQLSVLGAPAQAERLARVILEQTSTFGVRVEELSRYKLDRELVSVETPFGEVGAKVGYLGGERVKAAPEYEACAQLAEEHGVPVREVYEAALVALSRGGQ